MKTTIATLCALFILGITAIAGDQPKTTDKNAAAKSSVDSADMMKAWMEYMTPGQMHKMLESFNGTWNEEIKMWMDPSAPATTSKATAVNTMIMGGRYQQSRHSGNMEGMPFEGMSIVGYDNATKKFVSTWIDNMGTGVMTMEGTWDAAKKTITFTGGMVDPITKTYTKMRETMKIVDDNTQVLEMYCTPDGGKEFKNMEIKMTRAKK